MDMEKIKSGSSAFRQLSIAMLVAGFSTFALLYGMQPLLPVFCLDFGLSAEKASLAISVATGTMALTLIAAGLISDRIGRRPVMVMALLCSSLFTIVAPLAPGWGGFLAARFFCGLALAGIPASAMAYISEEVEDGAIGRALGLYIAGSAIGGMSGRLFISVITQFAGWRTAVAATGLIALLLAIAFWRLAPVARHFRKRSHSPRSFIKSLHSIFSDLALPWLFLEAFLLMGAFITIYNYAGFHLLAPPYSLDQATVGAIFLLYIVGSFSSAWAGTASGRFGPRRTLWIPICGFILGLALLVTEPLAAFVLGIAVITAGFFGGHSIASIWVARRARTHRAQAAALYLTSLYIGASLLGSAGGYAWTYAGWPGVVSFAAGLVLLAFGISLCLTRVQPLPPDARLGLQPGPAECCHSIP